MRQAALKDSNTFQITPRERMAVLAASILGSSMAFINGTAVTLALDPIQAALGASLGEMLWVASIYMLFLAALILIGGALGDFYGRRAVFAWGVGLFSLASFGCAMAPSPEMLIAFRAGQGIGAALLTPMSLTLIADAFDKEKRPMAIGLWSAASALMAALGPPIGGWLAEEVSWRGIFYLNIPFGLAALAITLFLTRAKPPPRSPERVDFSGAVIAIFGFAGISYGLIALSEATNRHMLSGDALFWGGPIIVGIILLALFVRVERRAEHPMLPLELFRSSMFNSINIITMLLYGAMGGIFVFYPIVLKDAYGLGVNQTGIAFLGFAVPMSLLTVVSGILVRRFGVRLMLVTGSVFSGLAFACMGLLPISGTILGAFLSMTVFGIGMALVVPAMTTAIFNATPEESHGSASGINNAAARAGTLFAIAGYGAIVAYAYDSVAGPAARMVGYGAGERLQGPALTQYQAAMAQSFEALVWTSIVIALIAALVAAFFMSGKVDTKGFEPKAKHQLLGYLRLFETAPTRQKHVEESSQSGKTDEQNQ
jgi:EmrB/QacA subfamily drug resistance transporter